MTTTQHGLRALPDDIADLLALERGAPVPAGSEQRVLACVEHTVAAPTVLANAPVAPAASKLIVGSIAAALLAVGGAGVYLASAGDDVEPRAVPVIAEPHAAPAERAVSWRSSGAEPAAHPAPPVTGIDSSAARDTLVAERAVLDRAQAAILDADGSAALAAVAEHRRRFARGKLVEERAALHVQALVIAGRHDEARRRGERFLARYRRSIQRGAVRAALESME